MNKYLLAYAKLLALKDNVDRRSNYVNERYIDDFHSALKYIEDSLGIEVFSSKEFQIPASDIKHKILTTNHRTGETKYSSDCFFDTKRFNINLDSAMNYLGLIAPKEVKQQIGFHA